MSESRFLQFVLAVVGGCVAVLLLDWYYIRNIVIGPMPTLLLYGSAFVFFSLLAYLSIPQLGELLKQSTLPEEKVTTYWYAFLTIGVVSGFSMNVVHRLGATLVGRGQILSMATVLSGGITAVATALFLYHDSGG